MPINLRNILEGLTQLNPQAAQQLAQRKSAAEVLKQRLFDQGESAKRDARADQDFQLRKQEYDLQKKKLDWQMTPDDPNSITGPSRSRANAGGSALNAPDAIPAEKQFEGITKGTMEPAEMTNQPIDVTRGDQTTSIPWQQPQTNGLPFVQGAGGVTMIPRLPADAQATEAAGKRTEAKSQAQGTQEGQTAGKFEAWQQLFSDPAGEKMAQADKDLPGAVLAHSLTGYSMPADKFDSFKSQLAQQYYQALQDGDKDTLSKIEKTIDTFVPGAGKKAGAAGGGLNPGAIQAYAKAVRLMGPLALTNLGIGNAGSEMKEAIINEAFDPKYGSAPSIPEQMANFRGWESVEKSMDSGELGKSNNAINTVMGHFRDLRRAAAMLQNGDLQGLNALAQSLGEQTGNSAPTVYDTINDRIAAENARVYVPTGGTLEDRIGNRKHFDRKLGPDQIDKNSKAAIALLASKVKANQNQYDKGTMGLGSKRALDPENEDFMKSLGIDPRVHAAALPASAPAPGGPVNPTYPTGVSNIRPPGIPAPPPPVGTISNGFRFKGGNPNDQNNWEPINGPVPAPPR